MLLGQYPTKINVKGRVALPAKFKKELGKKLIVTVGYEQSIMVMEPKDWQVVIDKMTSQKSPLEPGRDTDRFFFGSAFEVELDNQGRFVIPRYLRAHASLTDEIVFVGMGNRAEIWGRPAWEKYNQLLTKKLSASTGSFTSSR